MPRVAAAPEVVMSPVYALIWGATVIFGATAVAALTWAVQTGQMRDPAIGARSIFDPDEPVGRVTDSYPLVADPPGSARQERP